MKLLLRRIYLVDPVGVARRRGEGEVGVESHVEGEEVEGERLEVQ